MKNNLSLTKIQNYQKGIVKATLNVILIYPPCRNGNARLTTVPLKVETFIWSITWKIFLGLKVFNLDKFYVVLQFQCASHFCRNITVQNNQFSKSGIGHSINLLSKNHQTFTFFKTYFYWNELDGWTLATNSDFSNNWNSVRLNSLLHH